MARRTAFLFPGQGSQEVGMGRDLFGSDQYTDRLMACASEAAEEDLVRLCLRGPGRRLAETRFLQPALTAFELGLWRLVVEAGVEASFTTGHSLGEIPALVLGGFAGSEDAVRIAAVRGRLMGEAAATMAGAMIAVSGVAVEEVEAVVGRLAGQGVVALAAVNAPIQATVSGDPELVDSVAAELGKRPQARITRLRVSGAWHSRHMAAAQTRFAAALDDFQFADGGKVEVVFNRHGLEATESDQVRELIAGQLTRPVRFDLVLQRLAERGVRDFVEIGPGRVIRGLIRLNLLDSSVRVHNVSDRRSAARVVAALG